VLSGIYLRRNIRDMKNNQLNCINYMQTVWSVEKGEKKGTDGD
jgi:hypothetical protein